MIPIVNRRCWRVAEADRAVVARVASTGIPRTVAQLLVLRGIEGSTEVERFLNPRLEDLSDPFQLTDMRRAVDRIAEARSRDESVVVFGDYDVDGISGTAVLYRALHRFGLARASYGMPNRLADGYGLVADHVRALAESGVTLIITVDNGIAAHAAAKEARRLGVDLIVTDHHQIDGALPDALAVINPKREGPSYPGAHASGVAVAFKLATALTGETLDLDLVALGTVADIVPLQAENRILVAHGIESIRNAPRLGLQKLAAVAGIRVETLTAENIAFQLAPRINAIGRMGDGLAGLHLLLADDPGEAQRLATELNAANEERRETEKAIFDEAVEELDQLFRPEQRSIVMARRGWHPGVIGIVAARIHSKYFRPTVLLSVNEDGVGRGSARNNIPGFDLVGALAACREHLERFGGHRSAAGLTLAEDRIEAFRCAFEAEAARLLPSGDLTPELAVDAQVSFSEIDSALVATLERLEPFGHANPSPVFCTYGATLVPGSVRELRGGHIRVALKESGRVFNAVGFNMADPERYDWTPGSVDVAFTPKFNTWQGTTTIQLMLKDVRSARD